MSCVLVWEQVINWNFPILWLDWISSNKVNNLWIQRRCRKLTANLKKTYHLPSILAAKKNSQPTKRKGCSPIMRCNTRCLSQNCNKMLQKSMRSACKALVLNPPCFPVPALNSRSTHAAPSNALWFTSSYHQAKKKSTWYFFKAALALANICTSMFLLIFWPKNSMLRLAKYLHLSAELDLQKLRQLLVRFRLWSLTACGHSLNGLDCRIKECKTDQQHLPNPIQSCWWFNLFETYTVFFSNWIIRPSRDKHFKNSLTTT